ncbi:MAG: SBBP repeat-containing protein [Ignavibacteria bacterium]|nr:SBBP repeat-containing protein [Ignavibacteria bacterium]
MKKRLAVIVSFIFLFPIFFTASSTAQVSQEWVARYNGPEGLGDFSRAITADRYGNVTVAGWLYESTFGYADILTLRYSASGSLLWSAIYAGGPFFDEGVDVQSDDLGNVYVGGSVYNATVPEGVLIIKYNAVGNVVWSEFYGGPYNSVCDLAVDDSGNVVCLGYGIGPGFYSDYLILKYDSSGNILWSARYEGEAMDYAGDLTVDKMGNIIVTGETYRIAQGNYDIGTVKYSPSGIQQWVAFYNGTGDSSDFGRSVDTDESGNVYVTGECFGNNHERMITTLKYNGSGQLQWTAGYPGISYPVEVITTDANSVYVSGAVGNSSVYDYLALKYDSAGNLLWTFKHNGSGDSNDVVCAMRSDSAGNIYLAGTCTNANTGNDFVTVKLDPSGVMKWNMTCSGPALNDNATCMEVDKNGSVYVSGNSQGNEGDIMTVKYSQLTDIKESYSLNFTEYELRQNFPNPFNPVTTIAYGLPQAGNVTVKIFDMTGREVRTLVNEFKEAGYHSAAFDGSSLPSGTYIYSICAGSYVSAKKMVLLK